MAEKAKKEKFLMFKGRPLVRCGNTVYYGHPSDEYVALLQVLSAKEGQSLELSDKISVQIIATDPTIAPKDRITKKTEKNGLYDALHIASIWLERTTG